MNNLSVPKVAALNGSRPVRKVVAHGQLSRSPSNFLVAPWGRNIANNTCTDFVRECKQHLHLIFSHRHVGCVRSLTESEATTDFLLAITARYMNGDLGLQGEMIRTLQKAKQQLKNQQSEKQDETEQKEQEAEAAKEVQQDPVAAVIRFLISLFT